MSDASGAEVLLDDFEKKDKWKIAGAAADRIHLTTFAEGAPSKRPGIYADGARGADHRALVLLVRSATDDLEVELIAEQRHFFAISGVVEALRLWVRSPHASIRIRADLTDATGGSRELLLGKVSANGEWQRLEHRLDQPITDAELIGLKIRLEEVIKREGEVMILLDDLTAHTR